MRIVIINTSCFNYDLILNNSKSDVCPNDTFRSDNTVIIGKAIHSDFKDTQIDYRPFHIYILI